MKGIIVSALVLASVPAFAQVRGRVIYGADDRLDLYQTQNAQLRSLADSTVALMHSYAVKTEGGVSRLTTTPYGSGMGLCKEEPFYSQVTAAFCSGSLVAPDVVMTAGHCVTSESACADTKFVFGFAVQEKGKMPLAVPTKEVYGCKKLLGREQVNDGADWALIKLDRPAAGHAALKLNLTGAITNKTPLVVIGHPAGLPTKIAGGATVRDAAPSGYFVANLDTYGGNSGSAVFNATTGLVEGILVRGETDYVYRGSCRVSNVCANEGCGGEHVTKISSVSGRLPGIMHRDRAAEISPSLAALMRSLGADGEARP
ncbi:MAG: trypsin-like peptidase domain-containing protein [Elusimicrobia bacterium]|nr:trypsin-like peptidase domain-containing protein [Elusimicrobiota bacterium]